jgi:hypothetical protein
MRRTPLPRVLAVAAVTAAVAAAVLRGVESRGGSLLPVPVLAWLVILAIAVVVGALGWNVRQYSVGKRPRIDLLLAARTMVLATASVYTGALLTGWYAAQVLVTFGDWDVSARRDVAVTAGVAVLAAVVLVVVGLVVERWCEVSPPDDDEGGASAAPGTAA